MVLDEPNDLDTVFNIDPYKFIVNKRLLQEAEPVSIDFTGYGFNISSGLKKSGGCSGCGTADTCG